jgi:hypothetical protein
MPHRFIPIKMACIVFLIVAFTGCGKAIEDVGEIGQASGDVMSSVDEGFDGGGGSFSLSSNALAASCHAATFSACSLGVRTRDFGDCTMAFGRVSLTGSVTLTFSDTDNCDIDTAGESVTRTADFTMAAPRGSITVSAPNGGQTITRTGDAAFTYEVGGMKRVLKNAAGVEKASVTTRTTSAIGVTGTSRANRVLSGGALEIVNETKGYTVSLTPENLTWTSGCVCAVSGKLIGTYSGAVSGSITIDITSCGNATVTTSAGSEEVEFDRCGATS